VHVRLSQVRINPLSGSELSEVQCKPLLHSSAEVKSVHDLRFIVSSLHVAQREVGHEQVLRRVAQARPRGDSFNVSWTESFRAPVAHLGGDSTTLDCVHQVLIKLGLSVAGVNIVLQVVGHFPLSVIGEVLGLLKDHVMRVSGTLKLFDSLLVQQCVVLVDAVDTRQIANVQKVHT